MSTRCVITRAGANLDFSGYESMPEIFFKEAIKRACHALGSGMLKDKSLRHFLDELRKGKSGLLHLKKGGLSYLHASRLALFSPEFLSARPSIAHGSALLPDSSHAIGPWRVLLERVSIPAGTHLGEHRVSPWDVARGEIEYTLPSDESLAFVDSPRIPPTKDVPHQLRAYVPWPCCRVLEGESEERGASAECVDTLPPRLRCRQSMWLVQEGRWSVRVRLRFEGGCNWRNALNP